MYSLNDNRLMHCSVTKNSRKTSRKIQWYNPIYLGKGAGDQYTASLSHLLYDIQLCCHSKSFLHLYARVAIKACEDSLYWMQQNLALGLLPPCKTHEQKLWLFSSQIKVKYSRSLRKPTTPLWHDRAHRFSAFLPHSQVGVNFFFFIKEMAMSCGKILFKLNEFYHPQRDMSPRGPHRPQDDEHFCKILPLLIQWYLEIHHLNNAHKRHQPALFTFENIISPQATHLTFLNLKASFSSQPPKRERQGQSLSVNTIHKLSHSQCSQLKWCR